MKDFIYKILNKEEKTSKSSDFSRFFREASSREKKKVFLTVARKASEEQLAVIKAVPVAR